MKTTQRKLVPLGRLELNRYLNKPLFVVTDQGRTTLYKKAGKSIDPERIDKSLLPNLYLRLEDVAEEDRHLLASSDRKLAIQQVQEELNNRLVNDLDLVSTVRNVNEIEPVYKRKIQETIAKIVEITLNEPRSGGLEGAAVMVSTIASRYVAKADVVKNLVLLERTDWTTAVHSTNSMAFMLGYCHFRRFPRRKIEAYGLGALLHDVGKIDIPTAILTKRHRLTEQESAEIRKHTSVGYAILKGADLPLEVPLAALQHHERLDGGGYPAGIKDVSEIGQIMSVVDVYEALTNPFRTYRKPMKPIDALHVIKQDVDAGRIHRKLFEHFAYSLT